jgi:TubC N-terminal docking domain
MTARSLLSLLREKGVEVKTSGNDRLVIDAPKGTITPELRSELAANKADLLRILQSEPPNEPARATTPIQPGALPIAPLETTATAPVSEPKKATTNEEIATLEAELTRLRTAEQARRAEAEAARLAAENTLHIEQERWQQAEHETAMRRAEKEKQRIEAEAREAASEETRRRIAEQEIARAEDDIRRMRDMENSRRADFEAQMRAADETHRLQIDSLRKAEDEQARRRREEERRFLDLMAGNKAQEDDLRRSAELKMQGVEERILRIRADEGARERAAEEAQRLADEAARKRAEEEARRLAEAEARRRAEEEARLRTEIEAQLRAEADARWKAEDEARRRAEDEARKRAQEEAQRLAIEEARRRAEAEERRKLEELARQQAEEAARQLAEEEARRQAEEQARVWAEIEARERAEAAARQRAEIEARIRAEVEEKLRAEEKARRQAEEARRASEAEASLRELADWQTVSVTTQAPDESDRSFSRAETSTSEESDARFDTLDAADEFHAVSVPEAEEFAGYRLPAETRARLQSEQTEERAKAVSELPGIGGEEAFRAICEAFDDRAPVVRTAAARALFEFQENRTEAFTGALREAPPERRLRIGAAMASSGLANEAISNLTGESREKTYDAFSLLFLMSKAGEIQPLMQAVEKHSSNDIRLAVIKLLALSGQPEILPAFRRIAVRGELPPEVRSALMEAIYQITSQSPTDAVPPE